MSLHTTRPTRHVSLACLSALLVVTGQLSWASAAAQQPTVPSPRSGVPDARALPENARKGLVYAGLRRPDNRNALCKGFELPGVAGEMACTHGPDPGPEGVDVRVGASIEPVSAEDAAQVPAIPCQGDGTSGNRVQLIYARAASAPDRFATYASNFLLWAAQVNDVFVQSAAQTGGVRHVRFVHDSSCTPTVAQVVLTEAGDDNITNTINELRSQGYNRPDRKYLVWMDANVYCGIGQIYNDPRPGQDNPNNGGPKVPGMVARVDNGCWGRANSVEAHELVHTLGGVQPGSPNSTAASHCTDDHDRMCYVDAQGVTVRVACADGAHENRLDCNKDDYFNTNPPAGSWLANNWNVANSSFLASAPVEAGPPFPLPLTGVYRPATGEWYLRGGTPGLFQWGGPGDIAVPGDYDGNKVPDVAVYRPATGEWYVRGAGQGGYAAWGAVGDIPVPADYDGNGKTDIAVYRPATGEWYVRGVGDGYARWGGAGDLPVPADYDGNGKTDIAVYRPATGEWYVRGVADGYAAWGIPGDVPVPADYDGDRRADVAIYRPSTGEWYVRSVPEGQGHAYWGGLVGDVPVPADYDLDGKTDMAIYRPASGEWYLRSNVQLPYVAYGAKGDQPLPMTPAVGALLL